MCGFVILANIVLIGGIAAGLVKTQWKVGFVSGLALVVMWGVLLLYAHSLHQAQRRAADRARNALAPHPQRGQ